MSLSCRFTFIPVFLVGGLATLTSPGVAAQPALKKGGVVIPAEPLTLSPGDALSIRTLVQRPPAVTGTVSWTIETRRHRGYLGSTALSPDGKILATGGMDGIIHLWNAESGEFVKALVGHGSYVYGLAFSPDGHTLASAGSFDGTARLWDVVSGMTLRILVKGHKGYTTQVAWSRDGKQLAVGGGTSGFITLWEVLKSEPVKTIETGNGITGIAWDRDGKLVAVSGVANGVQVWDLREGKTPLVFQIPGQNGSSVAWSPDGKWIAGGGAAKTVVWDAESGKEKKELDTPGSAVAFSPSGETLAVSSGTSVKLWATTFDKEPKTIPLTDANRLAWAADGSGFFGSTRYVVKWASVAGQKPAREIVVAADGPVQLTPGRPLITGMGSVAPQLWDVNSGKLLSKLEGHTGGVIAAAWSRDGKQLATASADKSVRIWDAAGKPVHTFIGHEGAVNSVAWADGKTLASGSSDKSVRVWQVGTDQGKVWRKHKGTVTAVAWSKDGKQLASGDSELAVQVGSLEAEKAPQGLTASASVQALAWSGNGKSLAVGVATGDVQVFATTGGKLLQTFEQGGSPPSVTSLAWAPDGITVLSGRGNHTTQVWQLGANNMLFNLPGMAPVTHVGWSPAGNSMILSENDRAVRIYDLANGHLRSSVIADARQVATVSAAGHYRVADEANCELVYVVQTQKGQETLTPKDFVAKYRFRNNPMAVVLMDK